MAGSFDRVYTINWLGQRDFPTPVNPWQTTVLVRARCSIDIGYVYGTALEVGGQVNLAAGTGETVSSALASVRERALSDARRIWRALNLSTLLANTGTGDVDPYIYAVTQVDEATTQDLGSGRLLMRLPLVVDIQATNEAYDP